MPDRQRRHLPVDIVRRMACNTDIIPVVLNGDDVVFDHGRVKRLATAEQRTVIEAMQATCSHPDCTVSIDDCRIHHLDPWGPAIAPTSPASHRSANHTTTSSEARSEPWRVLITRPVQGRSGLTE